MEPRQGGLKALFSILTASLAMLLLAGYFMRHTLSAVLTSLVLAYLLNPLLKRIEKWGLSRIVALCLLYLMLTVVIVLVSMLLIPYLGQQVEALTNALPAYVQNLKRAMDEWQLQLTPSYRSEEGAWLLARGKESLISLTQGITGMGYKRLTALAYGVFNLVLAPILVFFMLLYKQHIKDLIKRLTPLADRRQLTELGKRMNSSLERFILAMLLDCLLVSILTAIALSLLRIEFPLLNGLLAGFASIVPFVGVALAVIPPTLIGYAQSGDLAVIPKVWGVYFLINVIIEGNLIKPLVMKQTLRLNPLAVIFAVMAMGELMGFWGIVLAVPLAAAIKICAGELKTRKTHG
jgi:predicted PurR-regulated permease PerM